MNIRQSTLQTITAKAGAWKYLRTEKRRSREELKKLGKIATSLQYKIMGEKVGALEKALRELGREITEIISHTIAEIEYCPLCNIRFDNYRQLTLHILQDQIHRTKANNITLKILISKEETIPRILNNLFQAEGVIK